jgi:predicted nucleic acid-binding protein
MVVVDTNIIAYLYLPTEYTQYSEALLKLDAQWSAPQLWKSELRNVLTLQVRKNILDLTMAMEIQAQAELLLADSEFEVASEKVLILAHASARSAYDCEFISLAQSFDTKLLTTDRKLINSFPEDAIHIKDFVSAAKR